MEYFVNPDGSAVAKDNLGNWRTYHVATGKMGAFAKKPEPTATRRIVAAASAPVQPALQPAPQVVPVVEPQRGPWTPPGTPAQERVVRQETVEKRSRGNTIAWVALALILAFATLLLLVKYGPALGGWISAHTEIAGGEDDGSDAGANIAGGSKRTDRLPADQNDADEPLTCNLDCLKIKLETMCPGTKFSFEGPVVNGVNVEDLLDLLRESKKCPPVVVEKVVTKKVTVYKERTQPTPPAQPANECIFVPPSGGDGNGYVVFVKSTGVASCLQGAQRCAKCTNWARAHGLPGYTAYRVASASAILLPAGTDASSVWYCYGTMGNSKWRLR